MKLGDILLAQYPFTDASSTKLRPVVVVSANAFSQGQDRVVLPISSAPDPADEYAYYIDKTSEGFSSTGLRTSSSVKWTKPLTISASVVMKQIGRLRPADLNKIRGKLRTVFG